MLSQQVPAKKAQQICKNKQQNNNSLFFPKTKHKMSSLFYPGLFSQDGSMGKTLRALHTQVFEDNSQGAWSPPSELL